MVQFAGEYTVITQVYYDQAVDWRGVFLKWQIWLVHGFNSLCLIRHKR